MSSRYKVIVFDLGNTIIRFDHNISSGKFSRLCGLDSKKIYDTFFDSPVTRDFEKGRISPREFYKRIEKLLGIKVPYRDFINIWNDIFWEDEASCKIARQLKNDYRLFLLSNVNRSHFEYILKKFDIIKIFDEVIVSYIVGAVKPEHSIFEEVIRRAGGRKEELLYIDDREDLIKEALSIGIDSIRYQGAEGLVKELKDKKVL